MDWNWVGWSFWKDGEGKFGAVYESGLALWQAGNCG